MNYKEITIFITLPNEKEPPIGTCKQRHKYYLKEHRKATYTTLLTSSKLNSYLTDIEVQSQERFERLMEDMNLVQGITRTAKG